MVWKCGIEEERVKRQIAWRWIIRGSEHGDV